ncbi:MAG: hypothetical protein IPG21_17555 [Saprospiraceae bacterium]|nr:hypothetical protein [Candidatus Vicinibacter affinis]
MANEFPISSNRGNDSDLAILINRPEMFKSRSKGTYAPMDCDTIILRNDRKIIAQSIIRKGEYIYYQLCVKDSVLKRVLHINAIRQIIIQSNSSINKEDTLIKILLNQTNYSINQSNKSFNKLDKLNKSHSFRTNNFSSTVKIWEVLNKDSTTKKIIPKGQVVTVLLKNKPRYKEYINYQLYEITEDSLYLENRTTKKIFALYKQDILRLELGDKNEILQFLYIFLYVIGILFIVPFAAIFMLYLFFGSPDFPIGPSDAPPPFGCMFFLGLIFGISGVFLNVVYANENKNRIISDPFTSKWKWTEVKSEINPDKNLKMP